MKYVSSLRVVVVITSIPVFFSLLFHFIRGKVLRMEHRIVFERDIIINRN